MMSLTSRFWRTPVIALALVAACDDPVTPPDEGEFVGVWAGRQWLGNASAVLRQGEPEGDVLEVVGWKPWRPHGGDAWGAQESLSARVVFDGAGTYQLEPDDVSFRELVGGDAIVASYHGDGSPAGTLRVTHYDRDTRTIEGELNFAAASDSPLASYGSTARMEDGRFRATVIVQAANTRAP